MELLFLRGKMAQDGFFEEKSCEGYICGGFLMQVFLKNALF